MRPLNFRHGPLPVYARESAWRDLRRVFYYIFEAKHVGGGLPPITPHVIEGEFEVSGQRVTQINVEHGGGEVTAFRFSDGQREAAFVTDCNLIPEESLEKLRGLDVLILDALRFKPHPPHLH